MNYISESISDVVFHKTSYKNLVKILETNTLFLAGKEISLIKEKEIPIFYASFSRSLTSHYFIGLFDYAIIEVDGRRLSNKFKGGPFEYFDFYKDKKSEEFEDRLVSSSKNKIENFSQYIKHIYLLLNNNVLKSEDRLGEILKAILLLKKKNIPFSIHYIEDPSMMRINKFILQKTQIPLKKLITKIKETLPSGSKKEFGKKYHIFLKEGKQAKMLADILRKIMEKQKLDEKEKMYLLKFVVYKSDLKDTLHIIFNNMRLPSNPFYKYYIKLIKTLQKYNINSFEKIYEILKTHYEELRTKNMFQAK